MNALIHYIVIYEIGEPDHGGVTKHLAETMASSMHNAINNIWYRTGRYDTFRVLRAEVME